jgi:hypothetical protein
MYIEIMNEQDKRVVAGILVANGYTVRKSTIVVNNRKKAVLEAYKEGGNAKNE